MKGAKMTFWMKKIVTLLMVALVCVGSSVMVTGCKDSDTAEEIGEDIDDAVDDAGDAMEDAADEIEDEM